MTQNAPVWTCPHCHQPGHTYQTSKVSTGGWILFVVLLLLCFVLCWIPPLTMKERHSFCRNCRAQIN